jgi:hypothetical protein
MDGRTQSENAKIIPHRPVVFCPAAAREQFDHLIERRSGKATSYTTLRAKIIAKQSSPPSHRDATSTPSFLSDWSRMICGPTAQRPSISASTTCTTADDGRTIGPRIRISRPDGGSARCNASRARALRKNSSPHTPPLTTFSTSHAISRQLKHTASYPPRR